MTNVDCAVVTAEPSANCRRCSRLAEFLDRYRAAEPGWHNAPVRSFGSSDAELLIVGLAPGLRGANRTGRPFTGDYAGDLLYETLLEHSFARGFYRADPGDGLSLTNCMITNAVRCVPPENKPTPAEIKTCRTHLSARIASLPRLKVILALGRIAHDSTLAALECRKAEYSFGHGRRHCLPLGRALYDSYHCSRYNTNTGRLTAEMFKAVFAAIRDELDNGRAG